MNFGVNLKDLLQSEQHIPGTVSKVAVKDNLMSLVLASVTSTQLQVAYQSGPLVNSNRILIALKQCQKAFFPGISHSHFGNFGYIHTCAV